MFKSNQAVHEEYQRLSKYLNISEVTCQNDECDSNFWAIKKLKKRGLTKAGNQRYKCLVCNKSFTDSDGSRRHLRPEINLRFFDLLVSKVPLRKIAKLLNISTRTIYIKIDFLHKQCLGFVGERQNKLTNGIYIEFTLTMLILMTNGKHQL
jgi:transposase-like protein